MKERSYDRGCIDFNTREPLITLNKKGKPVSIQIKDRGFSEQIIEVCMIQANVCVAKELFKNQYPCMYRIHEKPSEKKIEMLSQYVNSLHILFDDQDVTSKTIQVLLESIEDHNLYEVVSRMALRSMQKAEYSNENKGHFGLSLETYCHFTSPIRRYSDLVVHRMLRKYIFDKEEGNVKKDEEKIRKQSFQMSQKEKDAIIVERKVNDYKMAEYMENHMFKSFEGTIISIMEFGFFVELDNCIEGLVPLRTLYDSYVYDELTMSLVGDFNSYVLGQKVNVMATEVNTNGLLSA